MAIKCPKCGSTNPDNARFCWNDGEKLVTTGFQPFRFRNGAVANSLTDLVAHIDAHWEDAKYHLYQGDFTGWLASIGRADLASEARTIVPGESDQNIGLEKFLQRFGPDAPPAPHPVVTPQQIDLGTINNEDPKTRNIQVTNTGRGYLYGEVHLSTNLPGLQISQHEIRGKATVTLTLEPQHLAVKRGYHTELVVDTNGGVLRVPFSCYVSYPVSKTILRLAAKGAIGAGIAGAIRGFLYLFEHTSWLSRELSEEGFVGWMGLWDRLKVGYEFVLLLGGIVVGMIGYWVWKGRNQ